jgi:hypothetical protein
MASSRTTSDRPAAPATPPPAPATFCQNLAGLYVPATEAEVAEWSQRLPRGVAHWEELALIKILGGDAAADLVISDLAAVEPIIYNIHRALVVRAREESGL